MFPTRPGVDKKAALLAQAKAERLARSSQKKVEQQSALQENSALRIQKAWRRTRTQRSTKVKQRADWDDIASQLPSTPALGLVRNLQLSYLLLKFYNPDVCPMDGKRLSTLCKLLLSKTVIVAEDSSVASQAGGNSSSMSSLTEQSAPSTDSGTVSSPNGDKKPMTQVPFQMILLHARYADLATTTIRRLLQLCIKAATGYQVNANANPSNDSTPTKNKAVLNQVSSPKSSTFSTPEQELYLSGPELRFVMAFVDVNTYRLPENVNPTIRTQLSERGKALVLKVLDSGKFYKDVRVGVLRRVEVLIQMQERTKKSSHESVENSKQKSLSLWITAIWRCCLLLQAVDKDVTEKPQSRPVGTKHKDNLINLYSDESTAVGIACHILTVPLFANCLDDLCLQLAWQSNVLKETLDAILDLRHQQFILSSISLNDALSLLGNIAQLCKVNKARNTEAVNRGLMNQQVDVAVVLLTHCQKYVSSIQTTEFRQYHPIFSWTNVSQKNQQLSTLQAKLLIQQLEYFWSREFALATFSALLNLSLPVASASTVDSQPLTQPNTRHNSSNASDPQGALLAIDIQQACLFYMTLMKSFDTQKTKILVNLMYLPTFLTRLWRFMTTLGPKGGMYIYLEAAAGSGRRGLDQEPLIAILQIFCECCARFFISTKSSSATSKTGKLFSFSFSKAPPQYATPKEFIAKVRQKDRTALQILETMPHVIPFSARLEIFRDFIKEEKMQRGQSLALVRPDLHQSTMVKVRRGYVLEDGYQNLGQLSANGWKNTIRVKFVNESGLDEAGIDQGGPFKEFMESFLESGFSPNLNLFTTSTASMNMLYPSPTSHFTHPSTGLELFRLFGKMLGKAMYEGLLIEVKFANFFLSKILGRTVFLDEMRSYDEQVFQNLMFVKKYEGNVEDLGLTFSLDEEVFGTHRTIELMIGGKDVEVTKENRINYIFKVSDYRLNRQIQDQSKAFIEGVIAGEDVDFGN
ncbi:Ubiquitin-protein ligase E3B [Mortierella sp. AD011]|nr:Ubiquitin-protein ligase E3B [Mortierella sp. AD011]